jgi:hypothetical protein
LWALLLAWPLATTLGTQSVSRWARLWVKPLAKRLA